MQNKNRQRMKNRLDFRTEHFVPSPKQLFEHPSGELSFGKVPYIRSRDGEVLQAGDILLRYGEHWGPNHGYGIQHILQEHRRVTLTHTSAILAVVNFVASIVRTGADVHCEYADIRGRHRPIVVHRPEGQVVLGPGNDSQLGFHYSVITAFPSTKAKGPRVGAL